MTTSDKPAAVARALTGAGTAIALIGMVTGFQLSAALAEQQAAAAPAVTDPSTATANVRGQAVRVLDPSLLPEITVVTPAAPSTSSAPARAAAPAAPAAPAPAAVQPPPPANGSTGGSGG